MPIYQAEEDLQAKWAAIKEKERLDDTVYRPWVL